MCHYVLIPSDHTDAHFADMVLLKHPQQKRQTNEIYLFHRFYQHQWQGVNFISLAWFIVLVHHTWSVLPEMEVPSQLHYYSVYRS